MIKGLSERRRLPRAGKIKLGVMVQPTGGKRAYPKAVDHFVCPDAVTAALGVQEPKELPIMFPVDDPEQIFPQSLKMYKTAGLYCLSADSEILTARGWLGMDEVGEGDVALTLNVLSGCYQEEPVQRVYRFGFDGEMLNFRTKSLDALVTPEHRVIYRTGEHAKWCEAPAALVPRGGRLSWPVSGPVDKPDLPISDDMLRVLGWIITDGSVQRPSPWRSHNGNRCAVNRLTEEERTHRRHYFVISQAKPVRVAEIDVLLRRAFGHVNRIDVPNPGGPSDRTIRAWPRVQFYLGAAESRAVREWLGNQAARIPRRLLAEASTRQLAVLHEALMAGDGSRRTVAMNRSIRFYPGHDWGLADDFQELCTRLGYRSSINIWQQSICVGASEYVRTHTMKKANQAKAVPYKGRVWCVSVPSGTFVARRNGRVFTTGNCAGDGETAKRWDEHGDLKERACPCEFLESGECHPVATLNFILPDVPGIGVYQIDTSNKASIVSLNTALEKFRAIFGGLRGIPFLLRLEPYATERFDEAKKQMVKTEGFALRLDSPYSFRQILEWRTSLGAESLALMPAPDSGPPTDVIALPAAGQKAETADGRPIDTATGEVGPESDATLREACLAAAEFIGVPREHGTVVFGSLSASRLADYLALLRDAKENTTVCSTVLAMLRAEYRKLQ